MAIPPLCVANTLPPVGSYNLFDGSINALTASLKWQQVIISLQTLLHRGLVVGGRSALESQGFSHYLTKRTREVHLYGSERPPSWLEQLPLNVSFVYHHSGKLFAKATTNLDSTSDSLVFLPWGQREWQLHFSSPERAILELLDQLPGSETFHQAGQAHGRSKQPKAAQVAKAPRRMPQCKSQAAVFSSLPTATGNAWLKRNRQKRYQSGQRQTHVSSGR